MTDLHLQHLTAEELRYYAMKLEEQVAALQTLGGAAVAQVGSRETGEYAQAAVVVRRLAGLVHRTHALLAADHGHATVVTEAECLLARVEDLVAPRRSGYRPDPTIPTVPLDELKPTGTAVVRPDPIRLKPSELWMRLSPEERVALLDEACAADAIARECDEQIAALRAEVERWKTAYEGREKYEGTEEIVRKWTTDPLYAGETGASDVLHLCATVNRLHEQLDAKRRSHAEYVEAHGKQRWHIAVATVQDMTAEASRWLTVFVRDRQQMVDFCRLRLLAIQDENGPDRVQALRTLLASMGALHNRSDVSVEVTGGLSVELAALPQEDLIRRAAAELAANPQARAALSHALETVGTEVADPDEAEREAGE